MAGQDTGNNSDYERYAGKIGFGFAPTVGDRAGAVTKFDFNGLYRTVIRLITMPERDISTANFTAYRPGVKVVSVPRSGQTLSYASGDDGAAQKRDSWPPKRFTDNLNGSVSDNLTGLV